jgi:ribonucleoside-triphosphate reductase
MSPEQQAHNDKVRPKRTRAIVFSRVCGFLTPISQWNKGKREEFKDRVTYKVGGEKR